MSKPRSSKVAKTEKPAIKNLTPRKTGQIKGGGAVSNALKGIGGGLKQVGRKQ